MKVEVYAAHSHVSEKDLRGKTVVVVDTLRASSTIVTALANGCEQILPVLEIGQAIDLKDSMRELQPVLGGERASVVIPGFDLGNSPLAYTPDRMSGKTLIFTTTNGTAAMEKAKFADTVYIGALINGMQVARALSKVENAVILCAGSEDKFSLDDAITAGYIINGIKFEAAEQVALDDLGAVCESLYRSNESDLMGAVKKAAHAKELMQMGFEEDIAYCVQCDTTKVLPILRDGRITV